MTETSIKLKLPKIITERAKKAGLLEPSFVRKAILTELERQSAFDRLISNVQKLHATGIEPMSDAEVVAEVKAARAERRARANRH